jgi:hypothetical protein
MFLGDDGIRHEIFAQCVHCDAYLVGSELEEWMNNRYAELTYLPVAIALAVFFVSIAVVLILLSQ